MPIGRTKIQRKIVKTSKWRNANAITQRFTKLHINRTKRFRKRLRTSHPMPHSNCPKRVRWPKHIRDRRTRCCIHSCIMSVQCKRAAHRHHHHQRYITITSIKHHCIIILCVQIDSYFCSAFGRCDRFVFTIEQNQRLRFPFEILFSILFVSSTTKVSPLQMHRK